MKKKVLLLAAAALPMFSIGQVSFTNQTSLLPSSTFVSYHPIGIGDLDGDKKDDIVILHTGEDPVIQYQNAPGAPFTEYVYPTVISNNNAWGMCIGDVNGNGFSDFLFGGSYDDLHMVMDNGSAANYSNTDLGHSIFLQGVNFADIDNDGNLDIYACHDDGPSIVLLGDGAGNFTPSTSEIDSDLPNGSDNSGNYGSTFIDIDNDCDIDLYVAKCRQGVNNPSDYRRINTLWINDGNGNYTEQAAAWGLASGEQSWSADFADIDNDGDLDCFMGQHSTHSELYINNGDGTFSEATTGSGLDGTMGGAYVIQSIFEDFDNDGWVDLLVTGANQVYFYLNDQDGTFTQSTLLGVDCPVNSFALGDLNSDGFIDIYATPEGYGSWGGTGEDSLYFNDGNNNNFLTVSLVGVTSNLEGIGARVTAYGGGISQIREIRSGASYGISNSLNAHFGAGSTTIMDSIVVCWPSGTVDVLPNVNTNQFITIEEGSTEGISTNDLEAGHFSIYPNPANDQIKIDTDKFKFVEGKIYSADGKLVQKVAITSTMTDINVSDLPNGQYMVTLISESGVEVTERVVIQH